MNQNLEIKKAYIKICVNGSRGFTDYRLMDEILRKRIPKGEEGNYKLIVGGARGADTLAEIKGQSVDWFRIVDLEEEHVGWYWSVK